MEFSFVGLRKIKKKYKKFESRYWSFQRCTKNGR